jgi:hypothetical protein
MALGDRMSMATESNSANGDANIQRAFRLGWRFAQLYNDPHCATPDASVTKGALPPHLPSLGELSEGNRTELILREITHDVESLRPEQDQAPGAVPFLGTTLGIMRDQGQDNRARKAAVLGAFRKVRIEIGATDARFSRAIDLGRMLADTVILANSPESTNGYIAEFGSYRLANAYEWLEDLHKSFPKNASDAVKGSLQCWEQWVADSGVAGNLAEHTRAKRALSSQGERWRRLLSGEIFASDLLVADNYRRAANNTLGRIARLAWGFVQRFWPVIALVLGGTGAVIWTILTYAPAGGASVAAVIATVAASLGVSWKSIGSTLGKVAAMAEEPLWNAEIREAIVVATFIPPVEMNSRDIAALRKKIARSKTLPVRHHESAELEAPSGADKINPTAEAGRERRVSERVPAKGADENRSV